MAGDILVLVDHDHKQVKDITFELLVAAKEAGAKLNAPVKAVLLGRDVKALASSLGYSDGILQMEHDALSEATIESYGKALAHIIAEKKPAAVIISLSNTLMGLGAHLSVKLNVPHINFCKALKVEGGKLVANALIYGGKIEADIQASSAPVIISMRSGYHSPDKAKVSKSVPVETIAPPGTLPAVTVRFKELIRPEAKDIDITAQDVLVSVGRGIQSKENIQQAEELAKLLGGAVSASRPIIDQGWLPMTRQVGKSGMTVKPKLYIALGISGAPEHQEGMKGAGLIIAINSDPKAPIFGIAHYGFVGDIFDVLPPLMDSLKK